MSFGWEKYPKLPLVNNIHDRFLTFDFRKVGIGLDIAFGKIQFLESRLFVGFPYLFQAKIIDLIIVLVPMVSFSQSLPAGICKFEAISEVLRAIQSFPLNYPFAIFGFSPEKTKVEVIELTTLLDKFLINTLGLSFGQMLLQNEGVNYEFKLMLPNNRKLAQEACAFANLPQGGIIIFGVDKNGNAIGIQNNSVVDELQLQITNILRDSCMPIPRFDFNLFENPNDEDSFILVVKIHEMKRKPCMTNGKVYIRSGPSVRSADPEEIRSLVIG